MKKGILTTIITLTMLLIGLTKVNALSLDGNYVGLTQINDVNSAIHLYKGQTTDYVGFKYEYTNTNGYEYIAFPYSGYFGTDQQIDIDSSNFNTFISKYSFTITLYSRTGSGGYNTQCELQNNFIVCPMYKDGQYYRLDFIAWDANLNSQTEFQINLLISPFPIIYDTDTNAIIENQNQNTQEIINQNATYSDEPKEETEGKNETADYEQKEQALMGSLDFNMTAMDNISINPNASAFVWQIADRLRSINPAIILLMTSILGMGLIKLILNR